MVVVPSRQAPADLSRDLRQRLRARAATSARVAGIEHEYSVWRGDDFIDFRPLAPALARFGEPWHPTDPLVFRCPDGIQLQADTNVAEAATPPLPLDRGFAGTLAGLSDAGRPRLLEVIPSGSRLKAESTHISVAAPAARVRELTLRYLQTFAPALMLLTAARDAPGMLVRPRPGRIEFGTEHVCGRQLTAALALAAGGVLAIEAEHASLPPYLELSFEASRGRFGWYASAEAFAPGMYERGRTAILRTLDGRQLTAQQHLEHCWIAARPWIEPLLTGPTLALVDRIVDASEPLGVERDFDPWTCCASVPLAARAALDTPEASLHPRRRPGFEIAVVAATWDFTAFRAVDAGRSVIAAVPRPRLDPFLAQLDDGSLDELICNALEHALDAPVLQRADETVEPGFFATLVRSNALLAPDFQGVGPVDVQPVPTRGRLLADLPPHEVDYAGVSDYELTPRLATSPPAPADTRPAGSAATAAGSVASGTSTPAGGTRGPKGTVPPPRLVTPPGNRGWRRWLLPGFGALLALVAVLVGLQALGGGDGSSGVAPSVTATPAGSGAIATTTSASEATGIPEASPAPDTSALAAAFDDPGSFMSTTSQGAFGSDGRGLSSDPPTWAADVTAAAVRGDDGIIYIRYRLPAELAARLCGEFDVTEGNTHIGEGVDWCAPGAGVPFYFANVQEVDPAGATGEADLVICTGITDTSDNIVRAWLLLVDSEGAYEAVEYSIRASNVPTATSGTTFPDQPSGLPFTVVGDTAGATAPDSGAETGRTPPDDLPADLIPFGAAITFIGDSGSGDTRLVRLASSATLAEVTTFYSASLGEPSDVGGTPTWFTDGPSGIITIGLLGSDGDAQIDIVLYGQ